MLDTDLLRRACGLMLMALAILIVDVRIDGIDVVNDVIGAVLLVVAAGRLGDLVPESRRTGLSLTFVVVPVVVVAEVAPVGSVGIALELVLFAYWLLVARAFEGLAWPDDDDGRRQARRWASQLRLTWIFEGGVMVVGLAVRALTPGLSRGGGGEVLGVVGVMAGTGFLAVFLHRVLALVETRRWARAPRSVPEPVGSRGA